MELLLLIKLSTSQKSKSQKDRQEKAALVMLIINITGFLWMMRMMSQSLLEKSKKRRPAEEGPSLMKMSKSKYATWEMDAGHTIILLLRSKQDNIVPQRLLLELTIIPLQMCGALLVPFLRW